MATATGKREKNKWSAVYGWVLSLLICAEAGSLRSSGRCIDEPRSHSRGTCMGSSRHQEVERRGRLGKAKARDQSLIVVMDGVPSWDKKQSNRIPFKSNTEWLKITV